MKHDSPEFAAIAEQGTILRCQVGSGLHGTAVLGQDDRDELGICIEPPDHVIGLKRFEQYIFRMQPEGADPAPATST
ncbi:DNA polymerase beta superfamily protein [Amycolatopsis japonica]|uniref:DNA polymerase beta superfamily protein n=1 Tax=Amycolatopsis japonica TaxID=208439 RepID=UPI000B301F40|nr:nucleotidyltransferase domain-containing protein [Amycolatopsis japonica]